MKIQFKVGQSWRRRDGKMFVVAVVNGDVITSDEGLKLVEGGTYWGDGLPHSYDLVERVERVYIAGPMTGYKDLNFPAFNAAAAEYRKRGCFVINPAEMGGGDAELAAHALMSEAEQAEHHQTMMRKDIAAVTTCDMLVVLPGYVLSRGAMAEIAVAQICGLAIVWPTI